MSQVFALKTEPRCLQHVSRVLQFLKDHGKSYPRNFTALDFEVSVSIERLWAEGDRKSWASDVVSGLGHFIPAVKPHLIGSWVCTPATPLSPVITYALAQLAFDSGWMDTAVLLIQRPNEASSLQPSAEISTSVEAHLVASVD